MDFVINNYIIFIIVGVILLMALIGYIADNTNFEKKPKKEKIKKDKKKKEEFVEQTAVENQETVIPDTNSDLNTLDDSLVSTEELTNSENSNEMSEISNDVNMEAKDDLNMMDSFDLPSELTDTNINNVASEQSIDANASIENNNFETNSNDVNFDLDNNPVNDEQTDNQKNEEINNETNTDDIWKF